MKLTEPCVSLCRQPGRHAALRGERLLSPRHELTERHVQPPPAGGATGPTRTRLQALRACPHSCRETGW